MWSMHEHEAYAVPENAYIDLPFDPDSSHALARQRGILWGIKVSISTLHFFQERAHPIPIPIPIPNISNNLALTHLKAASP